MKAIIPRSAGKKGGHYVPGIISHGMLYISGQLLIDPETGVLVKGDAAEHTLRTLLNVERILLAAGITHRQEPSFPVENRTTAHWRR